MLVDDRELLDLQAEVARIELHQILDAFQEAGVVIVGRDHAEGLASKGGLAPKDIIAALMAKGRAYGVYFYQDQAKFDGYELARKLGEMGFDKGAARAVMANLHPAPAPELVSLGGRD